MITFIRNTKSKCTLRPNIHFNSREYYHVNSSISFKKNNLINELYHNYSTAAEHAVSTPPAGPLNINNPLVILPQPRYTPREAGKIPSSAFMEHVAVLRACLKIGEIERADQILISLNKQCTSDTEQYLDIKLHNEFMEAYLEATPPRINEALQCFDRLNFHGLTPDLATFAILIRGYLR